MGEFGVFIYAGRTPKMATKFIVLATVALASVRGDADAEPKADGQVYGYSPAPAYGPIEAVYSPEPAYHAAPIAHPAAFVHHAAPVHHAVVHHAPVHHVAAPYHEPKPAHYEPPKCSIDNPKTWCLEDTENSVDRLKEIVQETYLCPSVTAYIQPLRAVNTDGKWRVVVNGVKAHYETLTQTARIE